jgi:hypothetical protein
VRIRPPVSLCIFVYWQVLLRNASSCAIKVIDFGSSCKVNERIYTYGRPIIPLASTLLSRSFNLMLRCPSNNSTFTATFKVAFIAAPKSS